MTAMTMKDHSAHGDGLSMSDTIARLQAAMLLKVGSKVTRESVKVTVGECLSEVGKGRLVGEALAGVFENGENVGVLVGIDFRGNTRWIFVFPEIFKHVGRLLNRYCCCLIVCSVVFWCFQHSCHDTQSAPRQASI